MSFDTSESAFSERGVWSSRRGRRLGITVGTIDASCTHEVEILLRWFDAEHVARGYECHLAFDGSYAPASDFRAARAGAASPPTYVS
jgi:hypothetical protein